MGFHADVVCVAFMIRHVNPMENLYNWSEGEDARNIAYFPFVIIHRRIKDSQSKKEEDEKDEEKDGEQK